MLYHTWHKENERFDHLIFLDKHILLTTCHKNSQEYKKLTFQHCVLKSKGLIPLTAWQDFELMLSW